MKFFVFRVVITGQGESVPPETSGAVGLLFTPRDLLVFGGFANGNRIDLA
jgi:hypothetical protein